MGHRPLDRHKTVAVFLLKNMTRTAANNAAIRRRERTMACPICDQKPMNCDCTAIERRQFAEIAELEEQVASLRLTDAEREAIAEAAGAYNDNDDDEECARIAATLHGLLKRTERRS